jgi:hypothetical protein
MKLENVKRIENEEVEKILKENVSKSEKMIELFKGGLDSLEISKLMGVRSNFSYNVISNYVRKNDIKVEKKNRGVIKDEVLKCKKEGLSIVDCCSKLKLDYSRVWGIYNDYVYKNK